MGAHSCEAVQAEVTRFLDGDVDRAELLRLCDGAAAASCGACAAEIEAALRLAGSLEGLLQALPVPEGALERVLAALDREREAEGSGEAERQGAAGVAHVGVAHAQAASSPVHVPAGIPPTALAEGQPAASFDRPPRVLQLGGGDRGRAGQVGGSAWGPWLRAAAALLFTTGFVYLGVDRLGGLPSRTGRPASEVAFEPRDADKAAAAGGERARARVDDPRDRGPADRALAGRGAGAFAPFEADEASQPGVEMAAVDPLGRFTGLRPGEAFDGVAPAAPAAPEGPEAPGLGESAGEDRRREAADEKAKAVDALDEAKERTEIARAEAEAAAAAEADARLQGLAAAARASEDRGRLAAERAGARTREDAETARLGVDAEQRESEALARARAEPAPSAPAAAPGASSAPAASLQQDQAEQLTGASGSNEAEANLPRKLDGGDGRPEAAGQTARAPGAPAPAGRLAPPSEPAPPASRVALGAGGGGPEGPVAVAAPGRGPDRETAPRVPSEPAPPLAEEATPIATAATAEPTAPSAPAAPPAPGALRPTPPSPSPAGRAGSPAPASRRAAVRPPLADEGHGLLAAGLEGLRARLPDGRLAAPFALAGVEISAAVEEGPTAGAQRLAIEVAQRYGPSGLAEPVDAVFAVRLPESAELERLELAAARPGAEPVWGGEAVVLARNRGAVRLEGVPGDAPVLVRVSYRHGLPRGFDTAEVALGALAGRLGRLGGGPVEVLVHAAVPRPGAHRIEVHAPFPALEERFEPSGVRLRYDERALQRTIAVVVTDNAIARSRRAAAFEREAQPESSPPAGPPGADR